MVQYLYLVQLLNRKFCISKLEGSLWAIPFSIIIRETGLGELHSLNLDIGLF